MKETSFAIEFQPFGIRLICTEATTVLDAARQAGIPMVNVCGGKGTCGKCIIQILEGEASPLTHNEQVFHKGNLLAQNERLACETILTADAKILIPQKSLQTTQILQTESATQKEQVDALIHNVNIQLQKPSLESPISDLENVLSSYPNLQFESDSRLLDIFKLTPTWMRETDWQINAICENDLILGITKEPPERLLGLAVDIGSTKIALYLLDLENGDVVAVKGIPNPQIGYGEDIMARLGFAMQDNNNENKLHTVTIDAIHQAVQEICENTTIDPNQIVNQCYVGNTAMHHIFLGVPSRHLASSPFTPVLTKALNIPVEKLGLQGMPGSRVYIPGPIAGFVGSDHLAFLLSAGFAESDQVLLGIDIGTNTEIALQKGEHIVSCSTASGPAFEGAHIRFGMRAAPGAIEHAHIDRNGLMHCDVIGEGEAVGICGSGILDIISELKNAGILNYRGRLDIDHPLVQVGEDKVRSYTILSAADGQREISLSQKDIDQILLAKGAIRSGIAILMDYLAVSPDEIDEIIIAGAFGSFLNPYHAIQIGMLPEVDLSRIKAVGNAAGAGARMMLLSKEKRQKAEGLAKRIEHLELNTYPDFELFFANGIRFTPD